MLLQEPKKALSSCFGPATQDRCLHLLLQQLRLTEGSPDSAPSQHTSTSPSQAGLTPAIAALAGSARPQEGSNASETRFWSTSKYGFCRSWKQRPSPAQGAPQRLQPCAARLSQEPVSVSAQTRSPFPSECHQKAGNYPGSILDRQQHVLGALCVCVCACQFVAIGTCPASINQAFRLRHLLGWHLHGRHPSADAGP